MNQELALRLAELVIAQPKECYRNAVLALYALVGERFQTATRPSSGIDGEMDNGSVVYVEGYVTVMGMVLVEHGWLEVDGEIVDPTLVRDHLPASAYLPVLRYTLDELTAARMALRSRRLTLPIFMNSRDAMRTMAAAQYAAYGEVIAAFEPQGFLSRRTYDEVGEP